MLQTGDFCHARPHRAPPQRAPCRVPTARPLPARPAARAPWPGAPRAHALGDPRCARMGALEERPYFSVPPFWRSGGSRRRCGRPLRAILPLVRSAARAEHAWLRGGAIWGAPAALADFAATCAVLATGHPPPRALPPVPLGRARRGRTRLVIRAARGWALWKNAPTILVYLPPRALPPCLAPSMCGKSAGRCRVFALWVSLS